MKITSAATRLVLLAILLSLASCASGPDIHVQSLTRQQYAPTSLVEVLSAPPAKPYVEIARIRVQGSAGESPAQLLAALQAKAGALGADAIIVKDESSSLPPAVTYNPSGGQYTAVPGQTIPAFSALAIRLLAAPSSKP
jgi:hypothetical protein